VSPEICAGTRRVLEHVRSPAQRVSYRYLQECYAARPIRDVVREC